MDYGFEYFCGANITVRMNDLPIIEAAGLAYSSRESKRPIWGYSSRHFDAVARGQVLIEGNLVINYVHQDYLFRLIEMSKGLDTSQIAVIKQDESQTLSNAILEDIISDFGSNTEYIENQKRFYWDGPNDLQASEFHNTGSAIDFSGGLELKIVFGDQDFGGVRNNGSTGVLLTGLHFTGKSKAIKIDEETIVESYSFFARQEHSLRNAYRIQRYEEDNEPISNL